MNGLIAEHRRADLIKRCEAHVEASLLWRKAANAACSDALREGRCPGVVATVLEVESFREQLEADRVLLRAEGQRLRVRLPNFLHLAWPARSLAAAIASEPAADTEGTS